MATPSSALQRPVAFVADAEADAQFNARRQRLMWRRRLLPLAAAILLVALWQFVVVYFGIRSFIAPSPLAVVYTLVDRFGILMANLAPTALEALLGFAIGNLAAIALGVRIAREIDRAADGQDAEARTRLERAVALDRKSTRLNSSHRT